jgi:hypothetical protein
MGCDYYVLVKKENSYRFGSAISGVKCLLERALTSAHRLFLPDSGTIQPITVLTPSTTNASAFSVPFTSLLNSNSSLYWGLGLVGYDSYLTTSFSYNITVGLLNKTMISVTVQPQDSTYLVSMRLVYIVTALTPTAAPHIELINGCTSSPI